MSDRYGTERFQVIRHHDSKGTWYRVIDAMTDHATIKTFRGQDVAHRYAATANAGWRVVHRKGKKSAAHAVEMPAAKREP